MSNTINIGDCINSGIRTSSVCPVCGAAVYDYAKVFSATAIPSVCTNKHAMFRCKEHNKITVLKDNKLENGLKYVEPCLCVPLSPEDMCKRWGIPLSAISKNAHETVYYQC